MSGWRDRPALLAAVGVGVVVLGVAALWLGSAVGIEGPGDLWDAVLEFMP